MTFRNLSFAIIIAVVSLTPAIDDAAEPIINLDKSHISQAILWTPTDNTTLECVVTNSSGMEPPGIIIYRKMTTGWQRLYSQITGDNIPRWPLQIPPSVARSKSPRG